MTSMPNIKFHTTCSYMMRAIVADCICGERPVIAYDQASNLWQVKCYYCETKTETMEEPFVVIDEWNVSSMTGITPEKITSRAQDAGHAARMYALRCGHERMSWTRSTHVRTAMRARRDNR